jgi:hypothetical protein
VAGGLGGSVGVFRLFTYVVLVLGLHVWIVREAAST